MRNKLTILLLLFCFVVKGQNPNPYPERYIPTEARTKYNLPLWLYNGVYLSLITKKSNQMQVLVRDSVSQLIGYKYISSTVDTIHMSYSAPLRRNGNTISVPLTKNSNMNRVLVQDSVTGYFSYKYLTAAITYSAGRGLTLGSNTFRLDSAITNLTYTGSGAASKPVLKFNGTPFSGGTGTTTKPMFLYEPSGTTSTAWNTNGTIYGMNVSSGFTGYWLDIKRNNSTKFCFSSSDDRFYLGNNSSDYYIGSAGNANLRYLSLDGALGAVGGIYWSSSSQISSLSNGTLVLYDFAQTSFDRLQFGGSTNSFPSLQRKGVKLVSRLADNSDNTNFQVKDTVYSSTWNGQIDVPTKNAVYDKVQTLLSVSDTATMLSKYLRKSDTTTMLAPYFHKSDSVHWHNQIVYKAPLASPTFTGTVIVPSLNFNGTASSDVMFSRNGTNINARLGDNSAYANVRVKDSIYSSNWNGDNAVPTKNAVYDKIETISGGVSGTYTPTFTNVANVSSFTPYVTNWFRVGDMVHVEGLITMNITSSSTLTQGTITLPIASTMTTTENATGYITNSSAANLYGTIVAYSAGGYVNVVFEFTPSITGSRTFTFGFTYKVI